MSIYYAYDGQNRRIFSWTGSLDSLNNPINYTVNVYTPSGQKLAAYTMSPDASSCGVTPCLNTALATSDQYFGGRRLAVMDQLGSVENIHQSYFPWGEPKGTSNPQDTWNFATYWADSATGLDYANNRYYSNAYGRFMTPDPAGQGAASPRAPQTWNRYAYVAGDPVNFNDPTGQLICDPDYMIWCNLDGFQDGNCDPSQASCNNPCYSADGMQIPGPFCQSIPPVVGVPAPAPPKVITLRVIDECIFPNGTGISLGSFTLEVEYQVLVNGQPVAGNFSLSAAGINRVNETVTNTGGNVNYGSGNWCLSTATCDMPGSLTPYGTFWDVLAGNGTANQSFLINGQAIAVLFPSTTGLTTWQDVFNSPNKSISVGNGAVKGNSSTRVCGSKNGDPSTK
jgi:RHS repeat-associated protein